MNCNEIEANISIAISTLIRSQKDSSRGERNEEKEIKE